MSRNSIFKQKSIDNKMEDNFNVVIMGNYDKKENIFSNSFPITLNNSRIKSKYINRYVLSLRERHLFPKDFLTTFHPEILDKFNKVDILILVYNKSDKVSFEYLKTFYYLYYKTLEEMDKPKNIIVMERNYTIKEENNNEEIVDSNSIQEIIKLFNAYFCDSETDEEKLTLVLNECLKNLLRQYNYIDDYTTFKFKELNKEINIYILIYGDKLSRNTFLNILMGSFFGVFVGDLIANYRNYQQFHEIYDATNSAPWYYGAISSLILFVVVVIVCMIIKLIIRNKTE